jgi:hypothetical protein
MMRRHNSSRRCGRNSCMPVVVEAAAKRHAGVWLCSGLLLMRAVISCENCNVCRPAGMTRGTCGEEEDVGFLLLLLLRGA